MAQEILQSIAVRVLLKAYLAADHVSLATGKTLAVVLSKNGAAFGNPSAGATNATEIGNGWYYVDLSTTDSGTLGPAIVRATGTGVDDVEVVLAVVKATNRGMSGIPDAAANANGGLPVLSVSGSTLGYTVSTLTTYTGNTVQTGDAYGRIGAAGAGLTALGDTRIAHLDDDITSRMASGSTVVLADASLTTAKLGTFVLAKTTNLTGFNDITVAAVSTQITTDHGSGSYVRNTEPDNTDVASLVTSVGTLVASVGSGLHAELDAVKSKTDQLTFSVANVVDASSGGGGGGTVTGYASGMDPGSFLTAQGYTAGRAAKLDQLDAVKTQTDKIPASPAAVGSAMTLDLTQAITNVKTSTVGGALHGAWATAFGKMVQDIIGKTLALFGIGGNVTPIVTFDLDDGTNPTVRTPR